MSVGKLITALIIIFAFSIVVLAAELLFVLWRRRSFRLRSSPPPISSDVHHPDHISTSDSSTKELLYFLCLKAQSRVEPSEAPTQKPDGSSPGDPVIDVFKLLQVNGPSRVLCTIKEEDREDVESTSMSRVNSVEITATERVSLQACLESEVAEEIALKIEDTKTVFSSPCDSPMFFTPVGSPLRDDTGS
ncbi:hypothetical protein L2E82_28536 [Cichorium intybus]|uniref:Uncharacterized protein n=1 Tax=Cichorium intybus TaxID=13427 RepID=A0ACB9CW13_CICIN|nr:hypothetical protein L2E82_28536 [Cichorium intybus]